MGKRNYKFDRDMLSDYMSENHLSHQSIVGESADAFILKTGKSGMKPLSKATVESWCIQSGKVPNMGMSEDNRAIYEASKRRNTTEVNGAKAKQATYDDDNLDSYRKQTKSYRQEQAKSAAFDDHNPEITSKHYGNYQSKKGR